MRDLNIRVARNFPPVPVRNCNRSAWVNNREETTTCTGAIPADALTSLAERFDESTEHTTERSKPMAEYLRFSTNIPEEVALKYPDGKQVPSKLENAGDQMMYSLVDGRVMYVPLHVADQIRELRIGPGERFNLGKFEVKEGNRRFIRWQLARVDPDPRWQQPAPSGPNGSGTAASSQAAKPGEEAPAPASANTPAQTNTPTNGNGTPKAPVHGNGHAVHHGIPYWDPKAELRHCYEDAIEVLVAARDVAAGKGLPVQFTGDDLRQVAATLYIDAGKDRRTPWNGGAR